MLSFEILYAFVGPPALPPLPPPPPPPPPALLNAPKRLLLLLLLLELGAPNGFWFAPGCSNLQFATEFEIVSHTERPSGIALRRTSIATVPLLVELAQGRHSE